MEDILIIIAAVVGGMMISRFYKNWRGQSSSGQQSGNSAENDSRKTYKQLKSNDLGYDEVIFFKPSLASVLEEAEDALGRPLNENEFNRAKNAASVVIVDADDARDWEAQNGGRANNFSFDDWQEWRKEETGSS